MKIDHVSRGHETWMCGYIVIAFARFLKFANASFPHFLRGFNRFVLGILSVLLPFDIFKTKTKKHAHTHFENIISS